MSRSLFKKRVNPIPFLYPELLEFKDAIRHSYWLHTEFNFTSDIQNYHVDVSGYEKNTITKAMLAISQIEVSVKTFWTRLYEYLPAYEISAVGVTFGESEERHFDAYRFLLEKLGMNELYERIHEFPALMKRVEYMEDFMRRKDEDKKGMILALILFSLFIEHISLFSQFYIMMSYNKFRNLFKGISNAVEATSKEEEIHGRFGIQLFQILHVEHNELFTPDFYEDLKHLASKAFEAEMGIVDWIYEGGDLDFARKDVVKAFIANRYNKSLDTLGVDLDFPVDEELLKETTWFDVEVLSTKETDFFNKRSTDYSKKQKQITADDLF